MGGVATQPASRANGHGGGILNRNPATGEVLGEVPEQSAEEVRAAVERAREAQRGWAEMPLRERCRAVLRFRDELTKRAEEVCQALSRETGKTVEEALSMEVTLVADLAGYF